MGTEIERKFLLADDSWKAAVIRSEHFQQGYLPGLETASVRVRRAGDQAWLNIKSKTLDISRLEFEYPIPVQDAEVLLEQLCDRPFIDKVRHIVEVGRHTWEIDVFAGENAGLVVAEVELGGVDDDFERPAWLGDEVSDDPRYYNVSLIKHPYTRW